ncbi:MAG: UDP-N-acetylmuramate--L-alanine ligase [Thermomicrobiales bacterium]|nr:UDP-N-acetylmuramate--L-alanine ligase [Thermomicrobiales bacterium]
MHAESPAAERLLPPAPAAVHFVGIGGIGMSGLARILKRWGYEVSGSDAADSPLLKELGAEGMAVFVGHGATDRAASADLVVATAAVRPDNPEIEAARAAGRLVVKRAQLLGALADVRRGIAVAGSHGKSTTSGMIVTALRALGADPSFAIGALLGGAGGTNAAPGEGAEMVVEADEYDWSFLQLHPHIAIVTNVDYDHPDLFPDAESYDAAFARFVGGMPRDGTLIIAADDPGCARLMQRADWAPPASVTTFGEEAGANWRLEQTEEGWRVTGVDDIAVPLLLQVPGRHNARNGAAALAALVALGYDAAAASAALAGFTGVGRRFEAKGRARGIAVIDDYAHHPREIAATLRAARERYPKRRLWAVFQPHTYSRLKALLPDFAASFTDADRVMILDVYAAREADDLGVSAADLVARMPEGTLAARDPADAARLLAESVAAGDVVLTLGAGSVTETGPLLLERLREGGPPARRERAAAPGRARAAAQPAISIPERPHLKVLQEAPMRLHTTWRIGGPADLLVRVANPDDLVAAVAWGRAQGLPVTVLGGGSNLLVGDRGIRGLVVLSRTPGEKAGDLVEHEDLGDAVRLKVAAQAPLSWTGRFAAERGWAGLDWGVGLPGTIGGATVNNAGAHGTEQKDHLERVVVLSVEDGEVVEQPAAWLEPAYRHTIIKAAPRPRPWVVLAAIMRLPKRDPAELIRLADEHAAFRKLTQPTGACAGSTFANPPGDFAGRLLEESGMKGFAVGGAAFSAKHANWIVNDGTATAADVRELIATAQERVREQFGVELRREVEYLGEE